MSTTLYREKVLAMLSKYPALRLAYHYAHNSRWQYTTVAEADDFTQHNHRDQLPNELVLDFDYDDPEENERRVHYLCDERFVESRINGVLYHTGNKGYHLHSYWKGLSSCQEPTLLKNLLCDWLLEETDTKVDRQLFGRHLVRFEGGHHEKALPLTKCKEKVRGINNEFEENEIPQEVWDKYVHKVTNYALRRMLWRQQGKPARGRPKCVDYFLSDEFSQHKDGGKRALFIIASYYHDLPDKELGALLDRYNKYNLKRPVSRETLYSTIMSVRGHKGRRVGCNYRHSLLRDIGASSVAEKCERDKQ